MRFVNWFYKLGLRFRALFHKQKLDTDMDEEMRSHIEMRTRQNIESGMKPEEARYAALRQFGWVESVKETCRDQRGVSWIENFVQDVRFGVRMLRKHPGFTAVAVLTLALGIGANTAIFSVVNTVLLRPLPYPEPDRLVTLFERNPQRGIERQPVSPANFDEWQRQNQVFEGLGFWRGDEPVNLVTTDGTEKTQGSFVSSAMFTLLGAKPLLGRLTFPEEDRLRGPLAAVLSHELWQRRFGGDANVVGKTLTVDRHGDAIYNIVGVLPPGFRFPGETELWMSWSGLSVNRLGATRLSVVARLKPGVTIERARAEMNALQARLPQRGHEPSVSEVAVVPLLEQLIGRNMKLALLVLWGVVAGVLLIACVNVANLLLARAADRQKEIALRVALGASRWRVIRQLLTESVLLALLGGALGVLLATWGLQLFLAAGPASVARLQEVTLDGTALLFTVLISVVTGILFGLAPAWQFTRSDLNERLKEDHRGGAGGRSSARVRNSLVVAEVALSLLLLIGAGLMLRSFMRLVRTDRGIKPEHVLTAGLDFSVRGFTTWTETTDTRPQMRLRELLQRLQNQPGVQAVGAQPAPQTRGRAAEGTHRDPWPLIRDRERCADGRPQWRDARLFSRDGSSAFARSTLYRSRPARSAAGSHYQ